MNAFVLLVCCSIGQLSPEQQSFVAKRTPGEIRHGGLSLALDMSMLTGDTVTFVVKESSTKSIEVTEGAKIFKEIGATQSYIPMTYSLHVVREGERAWLLNDDEYQAFQHLARVTFGMTFAGWMCVGKTFLISIVAAAILWLMCPSSHAEARGEKLALLGMSSGVMSMTMWITEPYLPWWNGALGGALALSTGVCIAVIAPKRTPAEETAEPVTAT